MAVKQWLGWGLGRRHYQGLVYGSSPIQATISRPRFKNHLLGRSGYCGYPSGTVLGMFKCRIILIGDAFQARRLWFGAHLMGVPVSMLRLRSSHCSGAASQSQLTTNRVSIGGLRPMRPGSSGPPPKAILAAVNPRNEAALPAV